MVIMPTQKGIFRFIPLIVVGLMGGGDQSLLAQQARTTPAPADTVLYTLAGDPGQSYPATDTLPDFDFRMYDPARKGPVDYATLGNLGSAARPLWFAPLPSIGFTTGFRAFDLYRNDPAELAFYRNRRTYSHAYFSRGRTQRDAMSSLKLSRTFAKGLTVALHYNTINNLGEYRFQRTKHGALSVGLWWPVRKNYEFFLIFASNTFRQQDNGGISDRDFFGSVAYNGPISVPILLNGDNARTVQGFRDLQFSQYLSALRLGKNVVRAEHQANYRIESWKFSDKNNANSDQSVEQAFYGNLLTDRRGLRHFTEVRRLDNTLQLATLRQSKNQAEAGRISAGIRHSLIWVSQETQPDSLVNNLFLTGKIGITPTSRFQLNASGDLGLLANGGEYRLQGSLLLDLGKAGRLEGGLLSQRRPPDLIVNELYSTARLVWRNDFDKPIENTLKAAYSLPKLGFRAEVQSHLVNNYLYFDQNGRPAQTAAAVSVTQILLSQPIRWGILRSENFVGLQQTNRGDVLRLPAWFTKNSLYLSGLLFKKVLRISAGADFRMNAAFRPDAYQPFTGQFHLQDSLEQPPFPWIDAFVAVKIQKARIFFRMENLAPFWNPADNLYLTAWHPQNRATFRLGISWQFLDDNVSDGKSNPSSGGPPSGSGGGPPRF